MPNRRRIRLGSVCAVIFYVFTKGLFDLYSFTGARQGDALAGIPALCVMTPSAKTFKQRRETGVL